MNERTTFLSLLLAAALAVGAAPGRASEAAEQPAAASALGAGQPAGMTPAAMTGGFAGPWHHVTGTVSDIDARNGIVTLSTEPVPTRLLFASAAVGELERGDKLTVQLAFVKAPPVRAYDAPKVAEPPASLPAGAEGYRSITGTVRDVDQGKGIIDFQTGDETLLVHFPPLAIRDLKEGDRITLHLAFTRSEDCDLP